MVAERLPQSMDGLRDAVVRDGDTLPRGLEQRLLGDDSSVARHQKQKDVHLPLGQPDGFISAD